MTSIGLLSLLEGILKNPFQAAADIVGKVLKRPTEQVEIAMRAIQTKDTLSRIALAGLLIDSLYPNSECTGFGPVNPMRDPSWGFTIRDISVSPVEPKVAVAHSNPSIERGPIPSAVPVIVEVVQVGLEARPDLVGVVETALSDMPSEATQIIRSFVAGFRAYYDCPDITRGNVALSALLSQSLGQSLDSDEILAGDWFLQTPWTAVMAAPLAQASFGAVLPGRNNFCNPATTQQPFESKPVNIPSFSEYPVASGETDEITEILDSFESIGMGFDGSGSGDTPQDLKGIQNLWALAIPDAIQEAVTKLFYLKTLFKSRAAQVLYVPTNIDDPNDVKRFLGQLNFDQQKTWGEVAYECACQGNIAAGSDVIWKLATVSVSEKDFLRKILTDETMISVSNNLPLRFVPWDRRTELVPSDLYLLKPIPGTGVAISMKVRIWQSNLDNFPFDRIAAEQSLYPSLRGVLSPCDVATFTPDPLLCVARTSRQPPGTQATSISSTTNNQVLYVNAPSSSATPAATYYSPTTYNAQAAAVGPNIAQPGYLQVRVAEQAWNATYAPSITLLAPGVPNPNAPPLNLKGYYTKIFPLGEMVNQVLTGFSKPVNLQPPVLPLPKREPVSIEAFLAWVKEKLFSFRTFRTQAQRQNLIRTVPRQSQVYLGLSDYPAFATTSFQASQYKARQSGQTPSYRAFIRTFSVPTDVQVAQNQGQIRGQFLAIQ